MGEKKRVVVGMSGGVDSSTVAYMLKRDGYEVIGLTMKHWSGIDDSEKTDKACCSLDDIYDAKRVCDDLGIAHYTVNFEKEFKEIVIKNFVAEYKKGRTPNPCVICNRYIKLGKMVDFAKTIDADYVATGHYAHIKDGKMYMGDDPKKDQAYFLAQVKKENMQFLMFPLGDFTKQETRDLAKELGVRTYSKKDSQEICFIEDDDYKRFLNDETNNEISKVGDIVDIEGNILGSHSGTAFYTIGQRRGLGVSSENPFYVVGLDTENNRVIVGSNDDLFNTELICENINILGVEKIEDLNGIECVVKTRSRDSLHLAKLEVLTENKIKIYFAELVRAITPGQLAVFYSKEKLVLGSGFINA